MISLNNVSKVFPDGTRAVDQVSFEVQPGELLVLVGTSGCGKTTTMKMINRLIDMTEGTIEIDGTNILDQDPIQLRRHIGYVFQETGLLPHMTVSENISIPLRLIGASKQEQRKRARELMELIHLPSDEYEDRMPHQLSGGQQQRIGVARALATDPDYLLMDEPFGALDTITRVALQDEFVSIQEKVSKAIVFVTHDLFEAFKLGTRIAVMNQGRIEQIGTRQELSHNPQSEYIKNLLRTFQNQVELFSN